MPTKSKAKALLTYHDAGVDIDAGPALIKAIAQLAARTKQPRVLGGIGGFGGLFDLKPCGLTDPVLVATTGGVGLQAVER